MKIWNDGKDVNTTDTFNSTLVLTTPGFHHRDDYMTQNGDNGYYLTGSVSSSFAYSSYITPSGFNVNYSNYREHGFSVRCIKTNKGN